MTNKFDINFLKKVQREVEPSIRPGETALEAIQRMEAEKMASMTQNPPPKPDAPPQQEVVFYKGYKLSRDFLTCMAICLLSLNKKETTEILQAFGFEMKDLTGKPIVLSKKSKSKRKK